MGIIRVCNVYNFLGFTRFGRSFFSKLLRQPGFLFEILVPAVEMRSRREKRLPVQLDTRNTHR